MGAAGCRSTGAGTAALEAVVALGGGASSAAAGEGNVTGDATGTAVPVTVAGARGATPPLAAAGSGLGERPIRATQATIATATTPTIAPATRGVRLVVVTPAAVTAWAPCVCAALSAGDGA